VRARIKSESAAPRPSEVSGDPLTDCEKSPIVRLSSEEGSLVAVGEWLRE
jgi:hypothetical protein